MERKTLDQKAILEITLEIVQIALSSTLETVNNETASKDILFDHVVNSINRELNYIDKQLKKVNNL